MGAWCARIAFCSHAPLDVLWRRHVTLIEVGMLVRYHTTPPPKRNTYEDIIQTITANADHHLQMHEQRKLGHISKPATDTTSPVHGNEVIGKLYHKNMVFIPITIDPFARFGPMFQSFLTSTESRPQEPWFTIHRLEKFNRLYANLMYKRASKREPPNRPAH